MAFLSGSVANSYELTQIIHAALRDAGWSLVAGLSAEGIDSVFHSTGSDGYQDIYIRIAANQYDVVVEGDVQFPYSDGYNGYVNAFAYQKFSGTQGVGEVGKHGPTLYLQDTNGTNRVMQAYNMFKGIGDVVEDAYGIGLGTLGVSYTVSSSTGRTINGQDCNTVFNGLGKMYAEESGTGELLEFDMTDPTTWTVVADNHFSYSDGPSIWSRKSRLEPMVWSMQSSTTDGVGGWATYNTLTGATVSGTTSGSVYPHPPWGAVSDAGLNDFIVQGPRRNRKKYIYVARGYNVSGGEWARYDLDTNTWDSMTPVLPSEIYGGGSVYVLKEVTGYTYDRIYVVRGDFTTTWWSIAIDDNGDPDPDAVGWIAHTALPVTWSGNAPNLFFHPGGKYLFASDDASDALYRWQFPANPTDGGTWDTVSDTWMYQNLNSGDPVFFMHNHLASKVEVDEFLLTPYWVFVDSDRVVAVTKTLQSDYNDKYNMFYAGLLDSLLDDGVNPSLSADAYQGSTVLQLDSVSGIKVGASYKMLDTNSNMGITGFDGQLRFSSLGEQIVVSSVSQENSTITIATPLRISFMAGAKIGRDAQPVCVTGGNMDYVLTTTFPGADGYLANNYPFQFYNIVQPTQSIQTLSERVEGVTVWPVILSHFALQDQRDSAYLTQDEVRGSLIGMYYISGASNEGSIQINGKRYMAFSIKDSDKLSSIAIGPME